MMDCARVEGVCGKGREEPVFTRFVSESMKDEKAETGRLIWHCEPLWLRQAPWDLKPEPQSGESSEAHNDVKSTAQKAFLDIPF